MDNFIVSARKYRPQDFESVVGQSHITTTLRNAIKNNQLAHAFLFCGPRGVGKTTCARILAKTINCEHISPEGEACNECQSCRTFNEGSSLNIHELDAASNNSVDDMRTLIDQVRFVPQAGKYKVYIIDEVHMLSQSAFNAFLKTLEEPPYYAIFILATTEKHKIIPTILSRCQIFDFKRITIADTVRHLSEICRKEGIEAETDALHLIALKSEGCLRDSLSILDKIVSFSNGHLTYQNTLEHLNILDYDYFFRVMDALLQQDAAKALLIFDEILRKGFEADSFLDGLSEFMRNLLVCKDDRVLHLMEVSPNLESRYKKAASAADAAFLVSALHIINDTAINFKQARNKRLHVEIGVIKLSYLLQAVQLIADEQTGAVSKKKLTESAPGIKKLRAAFPRRLIPGAKEQVVPENPAPSPAETGTPKNPESIQEIFQTAPSIVPAPSTGHSLDQNMRLTNLKGLKNRLHIQVSSEPPRQAIPLEMMSLAEKWKMFTDNFRKENKSSAAGFLEKARLTITGPHQIEILSQHTVQHRFIEGEKLVISEFLKKEFKDPAIVLSLKIEEEIQPHEEAPAPLSGKEQYLRMIEKYPLVKELKDKLNLEMDY